jgi:hypothetical protein
MRSVVKTFLQFIIYNLKLKIKQTMAIVKDPFFEKLSGRLGDFIFRQRNGKTSFYLRPIEKKNYNKKKPQENPVSSLGSLLNKNKR